MGDLWKRAGAQSERKRGTARGNRPLRRRRDVIGSATDYGRHRSAAEKPLCSASVQPTAGVRKLLSSPDQTGCATYRRATDGKPSRLTIVCETCLFLPVDI